MKNLLVFAALLITISCQRQAKDILRPEAKKQSGKNIAPLYNETYKYKWLPDFEPGVVLVEFFNNDNQRAVSKTRLKGAKHIHTRPMKKKGSEGIWKIQVEPGSEKNYMASLKKSSDVKRVELNVSVRPLQMGNIPNDPYYNDQQMWGMKRIKAETAWLSGNYGSPNTVTQLIDEPLNNCNTEFDGKITVNTHEIPGNGVDDDNNGYADDYVGWNFVLNVPSIYQGDNLTHGQHTGGTIIAKGDNSHGVVGVVRSGKILVTPFLGAGGGWIDNAILAVDYGTMMKQLYPDEFNIGRSSNSWGGGSPSQFMNEAILRAGEENIGFFAAAGNANNDNDINPAPSYPAAYAPNNPYVFPVIASSWDDTKAWFSSYGKNSTYIAAPGVSILSTLPNGTFGEKSGTSMACPHAAAADQLLESVHPDWTFLMRKDSIIKYARKVDALEPYCKSGGILDLSASIYQGVTNHTEESGCYPFPVDNIPPGNPQNLRLYAQWPGTPTYGIDPNDGLGYFGITADPAPPADGVVGAVIWLDPNWTWGTWFPSALSGLPIRDYDIYARYYDDWGNWSDTSNHVLVPFVSGQDEISPTLNGDLVLSDITETSIKVSWPSASDNVGVTGYSLYRNGSLISSQSGTGFTDNGLSPNTTYSYYYTARDQAGNVSNNSGIVSGTTLPVPPPPSECNITCNNLNATSNSTLVTLSWSTTITGTCTIASSRLERKKGGTASFQPVAFNPNSPYTDNVSNPGNYTYRVMFQSSTGQTFYSNEKTIKVNRK